MKFLLIFTMLAVSSVQAEITLDGSLGRSGTLAGPNYAITSDLGKQVGSNLFQSFGQFNINTGETATFSGSPDIRNVIGRVTGGNPSNIDGVLRSTIPNADVYLLNPYGILFGKNAKLDMQGSFHASTADYLRLGNDGQFHARFPDKTILSVAPPSAFGFLTNSPATITVQEANLEVTDSKILSLIGGDLRLNSASLAAPFGRINLASVASTGEVIPTDTGLSLSVVAQRGQIRAENSRIDVSGQGGGSVYIRGGRFELVKSAVDSGTHGDKEGGVTDIEVDSMALTEGAEINSGTVEKGQGGNIAIKVNGALTASGGDIASNSGSSETPNAGKGGNVEITAQQIALTEGAQIQTATFGTGQGGNVVIKVSDVLSISGTSKSGGSSGIFGDSLSTKANAGKAGNITIEARQLTLNESGQISSSTQGIGQGGNIVIKVSDVLSMSGTDKVSAIASNSYSEEPNAGNAGNITIEARQLTLTGGATIQNSTSGTGQGGNIVIKVNDVLSMSGTDKSGRSSSIIGTSFSTKANAGNASNITIEARQITLNDGAGISSSTAGTGQGGNIVIKVSDVLSMSGENKSGIRSNISSSSISTEANAGNAGNITIEARQIALNDGALIFATTLGTGQGGNIVIKVSDVLSISGTDKSGNPGAIINGSSSEGANAGKSGDITIEARQIALNDGAQINAVTLGTGQGGNIVIKVSDLLSISGEDKSGNTSGIYGNSKSKEVNAGNAGNITIEARQITLNDGARISNITKGTGQAGNIIIKVSELLAISGTDKSGKSRSGIFSSSEGEDTSTGNAGNITIEARQLTLTEGAAVQSDTSGTGQGGNIVIKVSDLLSISGIDKYSSILSSSFSKKANAGKAGNITIDARQIALNNSAVIFATTSGTGQGGNIVIKVSDVLSVKSGFIASASYSEETNTGNAGNITIEARQLTLTEGAAIQNTTSGTGQGGNIVIKVSDVLSLSGTNKLGNSSAIAGSSFSKKANAGNAGNITIEARQIALNDGASVQSATVGTGQGGNIVIEARQIALNDGGQINAATLGTGQGGNIVIKVGDVLSMSGRDKSGNPSAIINSSVSTEANAGRAGDITIEARQIALNSTIIDSSTQGTGQGGNIIIKVSDVLSVKSGFIAASSYSKETNAGNAGNITIEAREIVLIDGAAILSATSGTGQGGNIVIKVSDVLSASDSTIVSNSNSKEVNAGNAGNITIEARQIKLTEGSQINALTRGTGQGGNIVIKVGGLLSISGEDKSGNTSGISSNSESEKANAGNAGNITIEARQITLNDGAQIGTATAGTGQAGNIIIKVSDVLSISGTEKSGNYSSGIFGSSNSTETNAGKAGDITIQANTIKLTKEGVISARTKNAGGGNITLQIPNLLYLNNGEITTSVKGGAGSGGNITVSKPVFIVLDKSNIIAQAVKGNGGNIILDTENLVKDSSGLNKIDASSELGINGTILITSPVVDINGQLVVLSVKFSGIAIVLQEGCAVRSGKKRSSLVHKVCDGLPISVDDLQPSPLLHNLSSM